MIPVLNNKPEQSNIKQVLNQNVLNYSLEQRSLPEQVYLGPFPLNKGLERNVVFGFPAQNTTCERSWSFSEDYTEIKKKKKKKKKT